MRTLFATFAKGLLFGPKKQASAWESARAEAQSARLEGDPQTANRILSAAAGKTSDQMGLASLHWDLADLQSDCRNYAQAEQHIRQAIDAAAHSESPEARQIRFAGETFLMKMLHRQGKTAEFETLRSAQAAAASQAAPAIGAQELQLASIIEFGNGSRFPVDADGEASAETYESRDVVGLYRLAKNIGKSRPATAAAHASNLASSARH